MDTRKLKLKRMFNGNHYLVGATSGFSRGLTDLYITNDGWTWDDDGGINDAFKHQSEKAYKAMIAGGE